MKLKDVGYMFFGFNKHFNDFKFDFLKCEYVLPKYLHKQADDFVYRNQYVLRNYTSYSKQNIICCAIINQLKYRRGSSIESDVASYLKWFYDSLTYYKNNFLKDVEFIYNNIQTIDDLYKYHISKKLNWYTFYFICMYSNINKDFITKNSVLRRELKWIYKAIMIFNFDKEYIKVVLKDLEKKLQIIMI